MNISICFHNSHGLLLVQRLEVLRAVQQPDSLWDTSVIVIGPAGPWPAALGWRTLCSK